MAVVNFSVDMVKAPVSEGEVGNRIVAMGDSRFEAGVDGTLEPIKIGFVSDSGRSEGIQLIDWDVLGPEECSRMVGYGPT
jgi:hypothetical protein